MCTRFVDEYDRWNWVKQALQAGIPWMLHGENQRIGLDGLDLGRQLAWSGVGQ
jgi:hypothetical protein